MICSLTLILNCLRIVKVKVIACITRCLRVVRVIQWQYIIMGMLMTLLNLIMTLL